jgi:RNA polymerase sigma-70 factor (ECF subfamily)
MAKEDKGNNRAAHSDPTDGTLLRRFQNRDMDAATQLYVRYAKRLRKVAKSNCSPSLARRVEPDDIVQSVFGSFFRRVAQGEYPVPDGTELWRLLLVIALNKIRAKGTYHSAAKRDVGRTTEIASFSHAFEPARNDGDALAYSFLKMVINETMKPLSPAEKDIVRMRIDGYDVREIAQRTRISQRTVERCLQEFRNKLGLALEKG